MEKQKNESYLVSVVYTKQINGTIDISLKHAHVHASSKEEALGYLILHFDDEMKGYLLSNKVVTKLKL